MTDAELIEATRQGEREAFGVVVERYQRMVEAVAYSATGQRALVDDIVQDTFVVAWRTIDRLRDATRVRAWLCSIARNIALNARRRQRREAPLHDIGLAQTPFDDLSDRERGRDIAAALARLPARYREPLVLFYYEHCTVKEVADALAVGEAAIMKRLSRGRRRLGDELATNVEIALERKPSRATLAAVVLALLPVRAASAAPSAATSVLSTAASAALRWLRLGLAAIVAHWRIPAALLATAAALAVIVAGTERSNALAARAGAKTAPPPPEENAATQSPPPAPKLPDEEASDLIYGNISVASVSPRESCARGARGLVISVLDRGAFRKSGDDVYYEPSPDAQQAADRAAARAAENCDVKQWPELYLMCEATIAEMMEGNVTCYPYNPFDTSG